MSDNRLKQEIKAQMTEEARLKYIDSKKELDGIKKTVDDKKHRQAFNKAILELKKHIEEDSKRLGVERWESDMINSWYGCQFIFNAVYESRPITRMLRPLYDAAWKMTGLEDKWYNSMTPPPIGSLPDILYYIEVTEDGALDMSRLSNSFRRTDGKMLDEMRLPVADGDEEIESVSGRIRRTIVTRDPDSGEEYVSPVDLLQAGINAWALERGYIVAQGAAAQQYNVAGSENMQPNAHYFFDRNPPHTAIRDEDQIRLLINSPDDPSLSLEAYLKRKFGLEFHDDPPAPAPAPGM